MIRTLLLVLICGCFAALGAAEPAPVCTPDGSCYLPEETLDSSAAPETRFAVLRKQIGLADADETLKFLRGETAPPVPRSFWFMLLAALAGGFLLNLTPCVLPMIPVNLAIIGASGGSGGFRRGLLYGVGMALAYGILGILAAFAGVGFGSFNASPLFNCAVGVVLILLSLAMAGALRFDLTRFLPRFSGRFSGAAAPLFMGALAALLAGACVAPAVAGVLVYTAQAVTEGRYYAAIIPFALGVGMAIPWPLAGAGLAVLPKPGKFMAAVKYLFAAAIFLAGAYYVMLGIRLASPPAFPADGEAALEAARTEAMRTKRPILVKFTASWCKNCAVMERGALADPRVKQALEDEVVAVTFPVADPPEPRIAAMLKAWGVPGFPALVLLEPVTSQK